MAMEVRRIVTGHDANGKAVIKTDERLPAVSRLGRPHIAGRRSSVLIKIGRAHV